MDLFRLPRKLSIQRPENLLRTASSASGGFAESYSQTLASGGSSLRRTEITLAPLSDSKYAYIRKPTFRDERQACLATYVKCDIVSLRVLRFPTSARRLTSSVCSGVQTSEITIPSSSFASTVSSSGVRTPRGVDATERGVAEGVFADGVFGVDAGVGARTGTSITCFFFKQKCCVPQIIRRCSCGHSVYFTCESIRASDREIHSRETDYHPKSELARYTSN